MVRTRKHTEKVRQGTQVKLQYRGPYPVHLQEQCSATSLAQQNPSSVVGADIFPYSIVGAINSHTVRLPSPHVPLGINSVVGAGIYRTRRTW